MSGIGRLKKYGVTKDQWIAERAAGRRWCSGKCKAFIPVEKFNTRSKGICKACESVISKRWRDSLSFEERKEKWTKYRTPETLRAMRERAKRIRAALTPSERNAVAFKNRLAVQIALKRQSSGSMRNSRSKTVAARRAASRWAGGVLRLIIITNAVPAAWRAGNVIAA